MIDTTSAASFECSSANIIALAIDSRCKVNPRRMSSSSSLSRSRSLGCFEGPLMSLAFFADESRPWFPSYCLCFLGRRRGDNDLELDLESRRWRRGSRLRALVCGGIQNGPPRAI